MRTHREMRAGGRRLVLRDASPPLAHLLQLTLLDRTFDLEPAGPG